MNCISHQNREALCFCPECRQPICQECNNRLGSCMSCADSYVSETRKHAIFTIGLSIFFMVFFVYMAATGETTSTLWEYIITAILGAGIPFGWRGLSKITSSIFLFLPIVGWVIYFVVKFALAAFIGWILLIPQIFILAKDIKTSNYINEQLKQMRL